MRIACCTPESKNTHSEYVTLTAFSSASCTRAPQCYVTRTLSVLLIISTFICLRGLYLHYSTTACNSSKCKFYITSLPPLHCCFQVAVSAVSNLYYGSQTDVSGITLHVSAVSNLCALETSVACTPINTWRPRHQCHGQRGLKTLNNILP